MDLKKREGDENDSPVSFSRMSSGAASMWNGQAGASHDQGDHGLVDVKRKSSTNSSGKSSEGGHLVRSSSGNSWIVNYCDDSKTWKVKYSPTKAEETIMKHTHKPSPEEETVMKHTHKPSPEEETIMKHTHKAERRESTSSYDMKTVGVAQVCDEFGQSSDAAVHVGAHEHGDHGLVTQQ